MISSLHLKEYEFEKGIGFRFLSVLTARRIITIDFLSFQVLPSIEACPLRLPSLLGLASASPNGQIVRRIPLGHRIPVASHASLCPVAADTDATVCLNNNAIAFSKNWHHTVTISVFVNVGDTIRFSTPRTKEESMESSQLSVIAS